MYGVLLNIVLLLYCLNDKCTVGHNCYKKTQRLDEELGFVARNPQMHMSGIAATLSLMVMEFYTHVQLSLMVVDFCTHHQEGEDGVFASTPATQGLI